MNGKKNAQSPMDRTDTDQRPRTPLPPFGIDAPHVVYPSAVYTVDDLRRIFGLKVSSVRREVRLGRLRIAKRCGRYYCLGQWVLQWLGEGELKAQTTSREANADRIEHNGQSM